jgi:hypothetical protein
MAGGSRSSESNNTFHIVIIAVWRIKPPYLLAWLRKKITKKDLRLLLRGRVAAHHEHRFPDIPLDVRENGHR